MPLISASNFSGFLDLTRSVAPLLIGMLVSLAAINFVIRLVKQNALTGTRSWSSMAGMGTASDWERRTRDIHV
jgi:hypothetical protein